MEIEENQKPCSDTEKRGPHNVTISPYYLPSKHPPAKTFITSEHIYIINDHQLQRLSYSATPVSGQTLTFTDLKTFTFLPETKNSTLIPEFTQFCISDQD
jgi:WD40 repeat protein